MSDQIEKTILGTNLPNDGLPILLLTGFEPFGEAKINPSWELAQRFDGLVMDRVRIAALKLPVEWQRSWPVLRDMINRVAPVWVVLMGLADKRQYVTVEMRARNHVSLVPDNAQQLPESEVIMADKPEMMNSTLPIPLLVERFTEAGVPTEVSSDAGGYLCNWTLFHALAWAEEHRSIEAVGFIHLPALPEQGGPGVTLDQMEQGLRAALETLVAGRMPTAQELTGVAEE